MTNYSNCNCLNLIYTFVEIYHDCSNIIVSKSLVAKLTCNCITVNFTWYLNDYDVHLWSFLAYMTQYLNILHLRNPLNTYYFQSNGDSTQSTMPSISEIKNICTLLFPLLWLINYFYKTVVPYQSKYYSYCICILRFQIECSSEEKN